MTPPTGVSNRSRTASIPARSAPLMGILALLLIISAGAAPANAAPIGTVQQRGAVAGRVIDSDDLPLPGVSVQLVGPLPELGERFAVTDVQGRYEILGVRPGTYRVEAALPAFVMVAEASTVEVGADQRAVADVVMELASHNETVTVTATSETAPQIVERDSTAGKSTVSNETLQRIPLRAEQALDALPLIPGVVRGPDGLISIGGTLPSDSILLFNGMDLTDNTTGQYRLRLPLEAVDKVDVYSGVYPAGFGQLLGGVVDISTMAGTDKWKFEFNNFLPRPLFHNGALAGIEAASPRFRVSGPLVKDRLYISQAGEYHLNRIDVNDVPGTDLLDDINIEGWESLTQLDWIATDAHRLRFTFLAFPQDEEFIGLNGLTPKVATSFDRRTASAIGAADRWAINNKSFLDVSFQYDDIGFQTAPAGQLPYLVTPDQYDGNYFHREDRDTSHWQIKSTYSRLFAQEGASHFVEIGGELQRASLNGTYENQQIQVRGVDDQLLQRIDFIDGGTLEATSTEWAVFLQDRWQTSPRFRLDLGVRLSGDTITHDARIAPRVGFSWDLRGNSRTLLKGAAGLLYRRVLLGEAAWGQGPTRIETSFDGAGNALRTVALASQLSDDLSAPRSLLFTVEIDQRLTPNLIVRAKYAQRETDDQLIVDRLEPDAFDAFGAFTASSDGLAVLPGSLLLSNAGSASSKELELTLGYGLPRNGMLFVSYVRSSAAGDLNNFNAVTGERPAAIVRSNRYARLPFDTPNRLLVWGTIKLPWGLIAAPIVEWRDGFPFSVVDQYQAYVGTPNSLRFRRFFNADVQVTKDLGFRGRTLRVGVKFFNFDGRFNPRDVIANEDSARFGEFLNSASFQLRGKLALLF